MLAQYIDAALELARYEIVEDDGSYWGEIPGFQGVWAKHASLTGCQRELREALSDWLALRLRLGLEIPALGGMNLDRIGAIADAETASHIPPQVRAAIAGTWLRGSLRRWQTPADEARRSDPHHPE